MMRLGSRVRWTALLMALPISLYAVQDDLSKIESILSKADNIESVTYESVGRDPIASTTSTPTMTKVWIKGKYRRVETRVSPSSRPYILIIRENDVYTYDYGRKVFQRESRDQAFGANSKDTLVDLARKRNYSVKIIGHEAIDGHMCVKVQAISDKGKGTFESMQWLWEDKGLLVRDEVKAMFGPNKTESITENRNFTFDPISDKLFSVSE
jgi:outer membrane lipoprotein-sorting protein